MKTEIIVPILTSKQARSATDIGGAATIGKRTRKAIAEEVANLAVEPDSLDQVIKAAVKILDHAVNSDSKRKDIRVDTMSIHIGITAGGSVGILGTGIDVKAEASFEITFKVAESNV